MARLHSHGSGTVGPHGAICLNLDKGPDFCSPPYDSVTRCDLKCMKVPDGTSVNVFVFSGEMTEDQAMRIAAILKE